ncbi:hypothetical protein [Methanolobus psychrotolerans]|uniref:hypothetical protein n=1 Tax=Methanolobus psychrotolerans TaxID=1874706 RepID=UPI000B919B6D|nr:hypothetical protein [Methanolobus psychrotolerans]
MKKQPSPSNSSAFKKIRNHYIPIFIVLSVFCLFLQAPALANDENEGNESAISIVSKQTRISEFSHLIELYFEDDNYVIISESIVYSAGSPNNSEELVLWIPENAEIMQFQVTDMAGSTPISSVNYSRKDNLLYFHSYGTTASDGMPLLYMIRYAVHNHEENPAFRKVIREEEIFEYPISRLIIVVNYEEGNVPAIYSADGFSLVADQVTNGETYTSYVWSSPQFNELSIALQNNIDTNTGNGHNSGLIAGIILLVIVLAGVVYYKMNRPGYSEELEDLYEAELAVLAQIKEDRIKNKLSREEFEKLHKKHTGNALKIKNKKDKLKKT